MMSHYALCGMLVLMSAECRFSSGHHECDEHDDRDHDGHCDDDEDDHLEKKIDARLLRIDGLAQPSALVLRPAGAAPSSEAPIPCTATLVFARETFELAGVATEKYLDLQADRVAVRAWWDDRARALTGAIAFGRYHADVTFAPP